MGQKRLTGDFAPVTVISENRKDDRKRNMIKHVLFDLDGTLLPMDQICKVLYATSGKTICKIWNGAESADRDDLERCGGNGTE